MLDAINLRVVEVLARIITDEEKYAVLTDYSDCRLRMVGAMRAYLEKLGNLIIQCVDR
jgi:hypothetical protein